VQTLKLEPDSFKNVCDVLEKFNLVEIKINYKMHLFIIVKFEHEGENYFVKYRYLESNIQEPNLLEFDIDKEDYGIPCIFFRFNPEFYKSLKIENKCNNVHVFRVQSKENNILFFNNEIRCRPKDGFKNFMYGRMKKCVDESLNCGFYSNSKSNGLYIEGTLDYVLFTVV